jgi:hypothetical protein
MAIPHFDVVTDKVKVYAYGAPCTFKIEVTPHLIEMDALHSLRRQLSLGFIFSWKFTSTAEMESMLVSAKVPFEVCGINLESKTAHVQRKKRRTMAKHDKLGTAVEEAEEARTDPNQSQVRLMCSYVFNKNK